MQKNLLLILLFICGAQLYAQNKPLATVPFELKSDNRIYIKCRVNNSPDTLTFLFDTGSGAMVINQSILGKKLSLVLDSQTNNMGAGGEGKVPVSTYNQLSFGGLQADSVSYLAIPYGDAPFDGVFGNNLMKKYIIEINYHKKLLYFYDKHAYVFDAKAYDEFAVTYIADVPTVVAGLQVDDREVIANFEMDTGGDTGLIIAGHFAADQQMAQKLKKVASAATFGSDGVKIQSAIVVMPQVMFHNKTFYRIPCLLSQATSGMLANQQMAGIFGNAFLKRFDMILDLGDNKLFLKPNDYLYTPFYDFLVR